MAACKRLSNELGIRLVRGALLTVPLLTVFLLLTVFFYAASAQGAESIRIYRSTMPDGSTVLSDKPPAGARSVSSGTYVLTAPPGAAEAERDYWRRQSEAFNLRQQRREAEAARRHVAPRPSDTTAAPERRVYVPVYTNGYSSGYGLPRAMPHPGRPFAPLRRVQPRPSRPSAGAL